MAAFLAACTPQATEDTAATPVDPNKVSPFRSDDGKWGYTKGGSVIIEPKFDAAMHFKKGLARVRSGDLQGFIKEDGSYAIEPKFTKAGDFSNGSAPVLVDEKWGYIDTKGEYVFEPIFEAADGFSDGGYAVVVKDGKSGFIDKKGTFKEGDPPDMASSDGDGVEEMEVQ